MSKADDIQRHAITGARLQDNLSAVFVEDLDRALVKVNQRIRRLLLKLDQEDGKLVSTKANLGRALKLRQDIRKALDQGGWTTVASRSVDKPLDKIAAHVLKGRGIAAEAARLTPADTNALTAIKQLHLADLLEVEEGAAITLQKGVLDGILGGRSTADLVDELDEVLGVSARQARTIYDTALGTYTRQVNQLGTSGEDDELFLYAGPADGRVRPFCREHLGKVYTREQINEMSNGQLPTVLLTGGGYNCRHVWQPVSELDTSLRDRVES